jgi:4-carboxymuconolactone decarboxylase
MKLTACVEGRAHARRAGETGNRLILLPRRARPASVRACQLGDLRWSTPKFCDGKEILIVASTKTAAPRRAAKKTGERRMAKAPPSAKRDRIKAFTPALVDYTNDIVYGDLWERKALSKRDRSLITVAALVATYRPEQLVSHLSRAIDNGVTQEEITEVITHMAFYAGWPAAMSAAQVAYTVLVEGNKGE